mmetsp:Transcript_32652/g.68486  ORF Transcript_32652/g.68486 Transcript_32652/m.68486 type:complete len:205 (-) Transcript_32652:574-1188(-)
MNVDERIAKRTRIQELGGLLNKNDGVYLCGRTYGLAKKIEVATAYQASKGRTDVGTSINSVLKQCKVSWHFVEKIRDELLFHGRVLSPSEVSANKNIKRGAGSKSLSEFDRFIIMQLFTENPSKNQQSCIQWLYEYTGKVVHQSTIARFFLYAFPIKGGFVSTNLVPYDKYRPANESRAYEYIYMLSHFAPERVKFGDEKSLKG